MRRARAKGVKGAREPCRARVDPRHHLQARVLWARSASREDPRKLWACSALHSWCPSSPSQPPSRRSLAPDAGLCCWQARLSTSRSGAVVVLTCRFGSLRRPPWLVSNRSCKDARPLAHAGAYTRWTAWTCVNEPSIAHLSPIHLVFASSQAVNLAVLTNLAQASVWRGGQDARLATCLLILAVPLVCADNTRHVLQDAGVWSGPRSHSAFCRPSRERELKSLRSLSYSRLTHALAVYLPADTSGFCDSTAQCRSGGDGGASCCAATSYSDTRLFKTISGFGHRAPWVCGPSRHCECPEASVRCLSFTGIAFAACTWAGVACLLAGGVFSHASREHEYI